MQLVQRAVHSFARGFLAVSQRLSHGPEITLLEVAQENCRAILGAEPSGRTIGTVATTVIGYLAGAHVFRVHDVKPNFEALRVALAVREGVVAP